MGEWNQIVAETYDNDVRVFAMLKYWSKEKIMICCIFIGRERHKPFLGFFILIMGVPL